MHAAGTPFLRGALEWIYGADPPSVCPDCGFAWDLSFLEARDAIASSPDRIEETLAGRDGMVPQADGSWNATAYVWHLTDLARSWSERWVQMLTEPGSQLVGWDPDDLAEVRAYRSLPTAPGLWALRSAVDTFIAATDALTPNTTFLHGDWGSGTVADGMRWLAHEFHHHEQDIFRRCR